MFSTPLGADSSLTHQQLSPLRYLRCIWWLLEMNIISWSSSTGSRLANIDFSQELLNEESKEKLKGKIRQIENKLNRERGFHRTIFANYKNEIMQNVKETRYRMHLYWYKERIQQCEILLAHMGSIQALKTIPLSLASPVGPTISLIPCFTSQVHPQSSGEAHQPSTAK